MLPLALAALIAPQNAPPRFSTVVLRNFEAWDADRNGALTPVEIERAALDHRFRGPDGAALAALHVWLAGKSATEERSVPRLERRWFAAYQPTRLTIPKGTSSAEARRRRREYAASPASLGTTYLAGVRRLAATGEPPIYSREGPALGDIRQGALGDCYVLAPLGALVHRDPQAVRTMIRPTLDGAKSGYVVRFGDGKEIRVNELTDAELAMGGAATTGGLWTRVLEKAFGRRDLPEDEPEISRDRMQGGKTAAARALTGREFDSVGLVGDFRKEVPGSELAGRCDRVRKAMIPALAARRLVLASSLSGEMPRSLNAKHAYAILGFNPATDAVTIWNPHGTDFAPGGPEGPEHGYVRRGGVFALPLMTFVRAFSRLLIEKGLAALSYPR